MTHLVNGCKRAIAKATSSTDHPYIADHILNSAFTRFANTVNVAQYGHCKRHGSSTPGPMEARRRLSKRRMGGLAMPATAQSDWSAWQALTTLFTEHKQQTVESVWTWLPPTLQNSFTGPREISTSVQAQVSPSPYEAYAPPLASQVSHVTFEADIEVLSDFATIRGLYRSINPSGQVAISMSRTVLLRLIAVAHATSTLPFPPDIIQFLRSDINCPLAHNTHAFLSFVVQQRSDSNPRLSTSMLAVLQHQLDTRNMTYAEAADILELLPLWCTKRLPGASISVVYRRLLHRLLSAETTDLELHVKAFKLIATITPSRHTLALITSVLKVIPPADWLLHIPQITKHVMSGLPSNGVCLVSLLTNLPVTSSSSINFWQAVIKDVTSKLIANHDLVGSRQWFALLHKSGLCEASSLYRSVAVKAIEAILSSPIATSTRLPSEPTQLLIDHLLSHDRLHRAYAIFKRSPSLTLLTFPTLLQGLANKPLTRTTTLPDLLKASITARKATQPVSAHVALLESTAQYLAHSPTLSDRQSFRRVKDITTFLTQHNQALTPNLSRALVQSGILRSLAAKSVPPAARVDWVLDQVAKVEGRVVAGELRVGIQVWIRKLRGAEAQSAALDRAYCRRHGFSRRDFAKGVCRPAGRAWRRAERKMGNALRSPILAGQ